jgi:hypothetical protein
MDIEWVIYHLIHNDNEDFTSVDLEIDYYADEVWDRLLTSLSRNRTLTKIRVYRAAETMGRTTQHRVLEIEDLFRAMRLIPHLQQVELIGFMSMDLDDGNVGDLFLNHATIERVKIDLAYGKLPGSVVTALASVRNLRQVHLELPTSANLDSLSESPTLEELTVETFGPLDLEDRHFLPLAHNNTALKELDLEFGIDSSCLEYVADVLEWNTVLQKVRLAFDGDAQNADEACQSLINAVSKNQSLLHFHNYCSRRVRVSERLQQSQLDMLERKNFQLESFVLFPEDDDENAEKQKNLYLKLNAGGRKRLFQQEPTAAAAASKSDWVDVITNTRDDLDCLLYYLSINPSLCKLDGFISGGNHNVAEDLTVVGTKRRKMVGEDELRKSSQPKKRPLVDDSLAET